MSIFNDSFNPYRQKYGSKPVTEAEKEITNTLLADASITKAIGLRMLTDSTRRNDQLGYLLAASALMRGV